MHLDGDENQTRSIGLQGPGLLMNRETAERSTILRGLVGSTVHGLNVNDGIEDRDEMGICVEPFEDAMSLWEPFEQFIYRSAAEREGRENARSSAGDLDLTIYSLRKWARLALKGNPTIMLLLFTPDEQLLWCDDLGAELRALTPSLVSRRVQGPFLGYLQAQKQRLTGERGQKRIHRTKAGMLERELTDLATASPLPEQPEVKKIEEWVSSAYRRRWRLD